MLPGTKWKTAGLLVIGLTVAAVTWPAQAVTTFTCGGFAPVVTSCGTGSHTRVTTISHDVAADINYVGTVESVLSFSGGERIFRCTYTQGLNRVCVGSGVFPPVNAAFTHSCRSLVPGTAVDPGQGMSFDGEEGGVGTWSCSVVV